jgi:hypothetical protein
MLSVLLKRIIPFIILMALPFIMMAQGNHFVYLQTENNSPFYVKMNDKIVNSSPTGYIILPNLADGNYSISIGFPKSNLAESHFSLTVYQKNEGYLLKNSNADGLTLVNMQTQQLLSQSKENEVQTTVPTPPTKDLFADMLANEVKDSSILNGTVTKPTTSTPITSTVPVTPNPTTVIPSIVTTTSGGDGIRKILSNNGKDGLEMVYVDVSNNHPDTVRAFIPSEKTTKPEVKKYGDAPDQITAKQLEGYNKSQVDTGEKKPEMPVVVVESKTTESAPIVNPVKIQDKPIEVIVLPQIVTSSSVNSDCKSFATDKDFLLIRKKMAAETTADGMIDAAKKIMRTICFSTGQIKNLSYLFLNDEGRYRFFDAAYPYTSDSNLYSALESQLSDPYYINRFRAMVQK